MKITGKMKTLCLFVAVISLALAGCDNSTLDDPKTLRQAMIEALGEDELQKREEGGEELLYRKDTQTPYTGWFVVMWGDEDFGHERILAHYKDGKKDGPCSQWDELGRMQLQGQYKDGKKDGLWSEWDEDGNESKVNYVDGEKVNP